MMRFSITCFFLVLLIGCQNPQALHVLPDFDAPLQEGKHYTLSSHYDAEDKLVRVGITAFEKALCLDPRYWPLPPNGRVSTFSHVISVRRGGQEYDIEEVTLDGAFGIILTVEPEGALNSSIHLQNFANLHKWTGSEVINFTPKVFACRK